MNRKMARVAAIAMSLGLAGAAQAIPLYLDFTGTVNYNDIPGDAAIIGDTVSGGFNFESDRLSVEEELPARINFLDWQPPANPLLPIAFFNSPGRNATLPVYDSLNYNLVSFNFLCTTDPCTTDYVSDILMLAISTEQPETGAPVDFVGQLRATQLLLLLGLATPLTPAELYANASNLEFSFTYGAYSEQLWDCAAGECDTSSFVQLGFNVDSYTLGTGPRTPVPEPATFGLLGIGMLGAFAARRRRLSA